MLADATRLRIVPVTLEQANAFVVRLHRHKPEALPGHSFAVGVADDDGVLRGVAITGNPSAPALQDGILAEIRRVCTDGTPNACSMLYGTARRAARAMGRQPIITYTLATESGASLRAAGFVVDKQNAGGRPRTGTTGLAARCCRPTAISSAAKCGGGTIDGRREQPAGSPGQRWRHDRTAPVAE